MSIIAKDFLLLTLGEVIPLSHLFLSTLQVHVGCTMGRSHYHVKVRRFKLGISRNVGRDGSLMGSFAFSALPAELLDYPLVRIHRETGQLSDRECNHR